MDPSSQPSPIRVRVLRSGSAGNAILVESPGTRLLIDAGLPAEVILREIDGAAPGPGGCARLDAILLTHEHDDHCRGVAAVARATGAVVLANESTLRAAGAQIAGSPSEAFKEDSTFSVGCIRATPFSLPHDAADPVGFLLAADGVRVAVACDLGEVPEALVERARGVDLLVIEANYDLRLMAVSAYPWFLKNRIIGSRGHLSNEGAAAAVVGMATGGPQDVHLVHLSDTNNLAPLARDTVREALEARGIRGVSVVAVRPNAGGPAWQAGNGSRAGGADEG